jgi:hypothetical protein
VLHNLSTHTSGALYETFPAPEAHRLLQRLEFQYTPKHASWLNMVEIEIGVLRGQCLDRRIGDRETLIAEIDAASQRVIITYVDGPPLGNDFLRLGLNFFRGSPRRVSGARTK